MGSSRNKDFNALEAIAPFVPLLVVALAGCGGGPSSASTQTVTSTTASTATLTGGSTGASKTTSSGQSAATTAKAAKAKSSTPAAPSSSATVSPPVSGPVLRRFSGLGNTSLGTIEVSSSEVLVWGAQRPPIQIFTAKGFILVSSGASSGSVVLRRGKYTDVRVASHAGWTIEMRARF